MNRSTQLSITSAASHSRRYPLPEASVRFPCRLCRLSPSLCRLNPSPCPCAASASPPRDSSVPFPVPPVTSQSPSRAPVTAGRPSHQPDVFFSVLVPPPRQLTLERQLNKSVVIGWNAPEAPPGTVDCYHVYVDGLLRTSVRASDRTCALIEGVDSTRVRVPIQVTSGVKL